MLTLIQVSACGCSFAFLFSAMFGIFAVANLMAAVLYTMMLVCICSDHEKPTNLSDHRLLFKTALSVFIIEVLNFHIIVDI